MSNGPGLSDAKTNPVEVRLFNRYTSRALDGDKYRTHFRVGTQLFALDRRDDTVDEADWARAMLARALDTLLAERSVCYRIWRAVELWLWRVS